VDDEDGRRLSGEAVDPDQPVADPESVATAGHVRRIHRELLVLGFTVEDDAQFIDGAFVTTGVSDSEIGAVCIDPEVRRRSSVVSTYAKMTTLTSPASVTTTPIVSDWARARHDFYVDLI
jgi:hypothetical protein